jgi:hypothetical protein
MTIKIPCGSSWRGGYSSKAWGSIPKLVSSELRATGLRELTTSRGRALEKVIVVQLAKNFPRMSWHVMVHYVIHKNPPMDPTLSHVNPIHTFTNFFKIHFNIILLSMPVSQMVFSFRLPTKTIYAFITNPIRA